MGEEYKPFEGETKEIKEWSLFDGVKEYKAQLETDFPDLQDNDPVWILMLNRGNTIRLITGSELNKIRRIDTDNVTEDQISQDVLETVDQLSSDGGLHIISTKKEQPSEEVLYNKLCLEKE